MQDEDLHRSSAGAKSSLPSGSLRKDVCRLPKMSVLKARRTSQATISQEVFPAVLLLISKRVAQECFSAVLKRGLLGELSTEGIIFSGWETVREIASCKKWCCWIFGIHST